MILLVCTLALAGETDSDFVRPRGELVFATPSIEAADRSPEWRARRAAALDRRLERDRDPALLEERADLLVVDAREALLATWAAWDAALATGDEIGAVEPEEANRLHALAAALYAEALPALGNAAAVRVGTALASVHQALGRDDEAVAAWRAVLAADPTCARAHLGLAEHAFSELQLEASIPHYEAALADPDLGGYATYKLAWTHYNLGRLDEATRLMGSLVADDRLGREAAKDLERMRSK